MSAVCLHFVFIGEKFTGAQGTAAGQAENYDYSKKAAVNQGAIPKSPQGLFTISKCQLFVYILYLFIGSVAQEPQAPGPRQMHRKGQQKGKKKGGKNRF